MAEASAGARAIVAIVAIENPADVSVIIVQRAGRKVAADTGATPMADSSLLSLHEPHPGSCCSG